MRQQHLSEQSSYEMLIIVLLAIITTPLALLITFGPGPTPLTTRPQRFADIAPLLVFGQTHNQFLPMVIRGL